MCTLIRPVVVGSMFAVLGAFMLACGSAPPPRPGHAAAPAPLSAQQAIDLTHPMHEQMAYWPGGEGFRKTLLTDYDQGYRSHKFEMGENTGTHVDAPAHFVRGQRSIDDLRLNELVAPAVVIDVRTKVLTDEDYLVSPWDIANWESDHGRIPPGSLVIANTGWHERFARPSEYANADSEGVLHFPGFSADAAKVLLERDVAGVGIDTLSIDRGTASDFPAHKALLGADKYLIENLANLGALPAQGATVVIGVLPVRDGTQAQARVIALVPR